MDTRDQINQLSDLESQERTLGNCEAADDALEWRTTMKRLNAVYEAAIKWQSALEAHSEGLISVGDYGKGIKEGQQAIYDALKVLQ